MSSRKNVSTADGDKLRSIRFPQALWDAIDKDADREKRSGVKHMEWILEKYLEKKSGESGNPDLRDDNS